MHPYRSHTLGALTLENVGQTVRLSGWVHRKRDHGGVLFVDLRDHYGITQIVADSDSPALAVLEATRVESVVTIDGVVKARDGATVNANLSTGGIEVYARSAEVLSRAEELPMPVAGEQEYPEDIRLRYRFLDLRRETLHANIVKRTKIISDMRRRMETAGFTEFSTPILTASSPEGARDFLVPSRILAGKFYALGKSVTPAGSFPRIAHAEAMLKYGSDKPDLRNPLIISDVGEHFTESGFGLFEKIVGGGGKVRAIPAPNTAEKSRKFFDEMNDWARSEGHAGLGYVTRKAGVFGGPIAKNHGEDKMAALYDALGLGPDDGLFFAAGKEEQAAKLAGLARTRVGESLDLIAKDRFDLCWIVDFPFYEWDEEHKKVEFAHNPFSMPQGGMDALENQDPLTLKAYQYDLVCNGFEIASGSIRNQSPELMVKEFEIVGLSKADVEERFGGLYRAFQYGAPPHGGMAAGVDRVVMLLCGAHNLREISLFPMNQRAEDLLMGAPTPAEPRQLRDLHIRVIEPQKA